MELGSAQTITRNKRMLTERDFIEKEGNKYASPTLYSSFGSEGSIAKCEKGREQEVMLPAHGGRKINCVMRRFFSKLIGRGSASAKGVHQHSRRA